MSAMHQFPPRIAYVVEEAMSRFRAFPPRPVQSDGGRSSSFVLLGRAERRIFPEDLETFLKGERPSSEPVSKMRSHVVSARA